MWFFCVYLENTLNTVHIWIHTGNLIIRGYTEKIQEILYYFSELKYNLCVCATYAESGCFSIDS